MKLTVGLICISAYMAAYAALSQGSANAQQEMFARGINLSGAELNPDRLPGIEGKDYIYPTTQELDYYAKKGFEVVRLPFLWERLQPALFGKLSESELDRVRSFVAAAEERKMRVILSPHNFGRYRLNGEETLIGTEEVPIAAFADFWFKMAVEFAANKGVYAFGLMNEPHNSNGLWKKTAQAGLDAVRSADHDRLVLIPGDQWSDASRWQEYNDDLLLNDPANRIMYEAHQYFDLDHSGTYQFGYDLNLGSPDRGVQLVQSFSQWLTEHDVRGIITEFGVPNDDPRWLEVVQRLLMYLAREKIPWVYWAGGPWWNNYPLSAEPKKGADAPIMSVLTKIY